MNIKKFTLPSIFLAFTIIVYIIATVKFCYMTKPAVTTGEFPFSITYEYKGETGTFSGVYNCEYSGSYTIHGEHNRYWEGSAIIENPKYAENSNIIDQHEHMTLAIQENMEAGYFMGDPLHKDHYEVYGLTGPEPSVEYYEYKKGVELSEEDTEALEAIGFKIIDYTYPEPIENSFSFSGIKYEADNIIIFVVITLLFFLLCLIFVRKDKEYEYSALDKVGIVFNFLVGIFAVPFITIICFFFGIVESRVELINQIFYNIPPMAILGLALSVVFRRKGLRKTGFFIQFGMLAVFILMVLVDTIL